jgi:hypothetical protein
LTNDLPRYYSDIGEVRAFQDLEAVNQALKESWELLGIKEETFNDTVAHTSESRIIFVMGRRSATPRSGADKPATKPEFDLQGALEAIEWRPSKRATYKFEFGDDVKKEVLDAVEAYGKKGLKIGKFNYVVSKGDSGTKFLGRLG